MDQNSYRKFIEPLRERQPRPSFSSMAELLESAPARKKSGAFFPLAVTAGLLLIVTAGLGVWSVALDGSPAARNGAMVSGGVSSVPHSSQAVALPMSGDSIQVSSAVSQSVRAPGLPQTAAAFSKTSSSGSRSARWSAAFLPDASIPRNAHDRLHEEWKENERSIVPPHSTEDDGSQPKERQAGAAVVQADIPDAAGVSGAWGGVDILEISFVKPGTLRSDAFPPVVRAAPSSAILLDYDRESGEGVQRLFLTAGSAFSQQYSQDGALRNFSAGDAFWGLGYLLDEHSSFRLLGMKESFSHTSFFRTPTYQDATFTHDGQTYYNVIGGGKTTAATTPERELFLGGSYRYTAGEGSAVVRPYLEALAGGGTFGMIFHQVAGMELFGMAPVQLDVAVTSSELLQTDGGWLTKIMGGLGINYRW